MIPTDMAINFVIFCGNLSKKNFGHYMEKPKMECKLSFQRPWKDFMITYINITDKKKRKRRKILSFAKKLSVTMLIIQHVKKKI